MSGVRDQLLNRACFESQRHIDALVAAHLGGRALDLLSIMVRSQVWIQVRLRAGGPLSEQARGWPPGAS